MKPHALHAMAATIPGDPTESRFLFCTVASRRARQLFRRPQELIQSGSNTKPMIAAMEETACGLVAYIHIDGGVE